MSNCYCHPGKAGGSPFGNRRKAGDPELRGSWESAHYWYWEHWKFFRDETKSAIIQGVTIFLSLFETDAKG
ncbi:MAG: hypothetical protein ACYDC6_13145 [Acidobacteriaceae bacterium]